MGTQWGQVVKEETKQGSKGIAEYTKCQSAVFAYSYFSMVAGILNIILFDLLL